MRISLLRVLPRTERIVRSPSGSVREPPEYVAHVERPERVCISFCIDTRTRERAVKRRARHGCGGFARPAVSVCSSPALLVPDMGAMAVFLFRWTKSPDYVVYRVGTSARSMAGERAATALNESRGSSVPVTALVRLLCAALLVRSPSGSIREPAECRTRVERPERVYISF